MASEGGGGGGTGAGSSSGAWGSKEKNKLTIHQQYPYYTPNIPFALMERGPSRYFEPEAYAAAKLLQETLAAQAPLKASDPHRVTPTAGDIIARELSQSADVIGQALNSPMAQRLAELIALLKKLFGGEKATAAAAPRPASVVPYPTPPPTLPPVSTDPPSIQQTPPPTGSGGGTTFFGGDPMALTLPFVNEGNTNWWEPVLDVGLGIAQQFLNTGGNGGNGGGGILNFDIPGVDIINPIVPQGTADAMACATAMTQGFHMTPSGQARPQPHVRCNPVTGKAQWFHPAKPSGFTMTHKTTRRRHRCGCSGKR